MGGSYVTRETGPVVRARLRAGASHTGFIYRHCGDHWTMARRLAASISAVETRPFLALDCMLDQASAW